MIYRKTMLLAVGALLLASLPAADAQSSANYRIARSVLSSGGGRSTSTGYDLSGTLGQPSPVDVSESGSYSLGSGFWGATVRLFSVAIESISYGVSEGVRITWFSIADATYTIHFTDSLVAAWTELSTLTGSGGIMQWLDDGSETGTSPTASGILSRFYRLSAEP
jgi:hypothetical protein